jgi:hypothetical protein
MANGKTKGGKVDGKANGAAGLAPADEGSGSAKDFEALVAEARAIPTKEIVPLRGDVALAQHNVGVALEALAPHEATLRALPAPFSWTTCASLGRLAAATVYAAARVDRSSPRKLRADLQRAREVRKVLMNGAVSLVDAGVFAEKDVRRIQKGSGPRDAAQDCVDLAALYRAHAGQTKGQTAVTKALVDEAAELGDRLLAALTPGAAKAKLAPEVRAAVADRDGLWTLLVRRYTEQARRAGMFLWVDDVDDHVPLLQSHAGRRAKKGDAAPAPAPQPNG